MAGIKFGPNYCKPAISLKFRLLSIRLTTGAFEIYRKMGEMAMLRQLTC